MLDELPVRIIETNFVNEYRSYQIDNDSLKVWNYSEVFRETFQLLQVISDESEWNADEELIDENYFDSVEENALINRVIRLRLNFVLSQCSRTERQIHQSENAAEDPIDSEEENCRSDDVNIEGIFASNVDDTIPALLPEILSSSNPLNDSSI